jgi:glycosyltransferase involved in cell wall biosynthesis
MPSRFGDHGPDGIGRRDTAAGGECLMPIDISVVIPTFRRPDQLRRTLDSVRAQRGVTTEVVVVDDCPDGSAAATVGERGDPTITYVRNPRPTGGFPSIVRNIGWPMTTGRFIHFLDDDDLVPDGHYAATLQDFDRNPDAGLIFGRIEPFGTCPPAQLAHERAFFAAAARGIRADAKRLAAARVLFGPAMLVCGAAITRRTAVARVGGFDPAMSLFEDTDFFCRVARDSGMHFTDRVTLRYRIGSPSLMHDPVPTPERIAAEREGARQVRANYRRLYGTAEYLALRILARVWLSFE